MQFHMLDWLIVAGTLVVLVVMALVSNRHMRSVSDYLVAGRAAGRYMMTMASGMVWIGSINVVAMFELYHAAGFTAMWWVMFTTPFVLYLNITGFGVYRFRETRTLTVAQFLETRYSKPVRTLAGTLAWVAGLVNFGLFPAVGARFFIAFCGLPLRFEALGTSWPTLPIVMVLLLGVSLFFVFAGGHVAVIVTDCLQGMFTQIAAVVIVVALFVLFFQWDQIVEVLLQRGVPEEGRSLLDPLQAGNQAGGFTAWFFVIGIIGAWYGVLSNLQNQAYVASARTAHEFRMGAALNQWRWQALLVFFMVLTLCAMVILYHPDHAGTAARIQAHLDQLVAGQPTQAARDALRGQLVVTAALSHVIPMGLAGLFCAIMVAALISTYDSFMHTWGATFLQDVVLPFRRRPFGRRAHMRWLRISILFVAVFALLFSWFFPNPENVLMYFALVNNLWLGGSGAVILGGLYWKRGTTGAALTTLILGAVLGALGLAVTLGWPALRGERFPVNPQWIFFWTIGACASAYWAVSRMGRTDFDMDRLLHRGAFAVEADQTHTDIPTRWHEKLFGIAREFNRSDRITAYLITGWFLLWMLVFGGGMVYAWIAGPGETDWARFWRVYLFILFGLAVVTTIWFTLGGLRDIAHLFRSLRIQVRDHSDDGRVRPAESPRGSRTAAAAAEVDHE